MMSGLDLHLFRLINRDLSNAFFDFLMPAVANPDPFLIPLAIAGVGLMAWGGRKGRSLVITALLLLLVTNGVSELLKLWVQRPRPCLVLESVRVLAGCSGRSFSFPSSHAANITAQALLFASAYRKWAIPLFLVAATVAYSRVYTGVHYPTDVIGGVAVGLVWGAVFIPFAREVERRIP
ncbi:MAG: phosphatase PAP2 family protein [Candidatus Methylomirabilales bacterium]